MKKIANFTEHLESPSINGIIFSDETIQLIDVDVNWEQPKRYTLKTTSKVSIDILRKKGELRWNDCAVLTTLTDKTHSIQVIAGEGDYGSDGFISVADLNSKATLWIAFFDCSDPFSELKVVGEEIHALSTSGCVWRFKINDPADCTIDCAFDKEYIRNFRKELFQKFEKGNVHFREYFRNIDPEQDGNYTVFGIFGELLRDILMEKINDNELLIKQCAFIDVITSMQDPEWNNVMKSEIFSILNTKELIKLRSFLSGDSKKLLEVYL